VAERDGTTAEQARLDNAERSALEHARYEAVYDIDLDDRSPYDLVLDSSTAPATDLADQITARAHEVFP
jgi:cytidylate kinase